MMRASSGCGLFLFCSDFPDHETGISVDRSVKVFILTCFREDFRVDSQHHVFNVADHSGNAAHSGEFPLLIYHKQHLGSAPQIIENSGDQFFIRMINGECFVFIGGKEDQFYDADTAWRLHSRKGIYYRDQPSCGDNRDQ